MRGTFRGVACPPPSLRPIRAGREDAVTQSSGLIVQSNPKLAASLKTFSRSAAVAVALIGAFGIPLVLGWLRLEGQRAGLYQFEFGTALLAGSTVVIFACLLWVSDKSYEGGFAC